MKLRTGLFPTLRTRLLFNLAPFVFILLAIGVCAIFLFSRITEIVDVNVPGDYQRVLAAQEMKFRLARMEGGVLLALGGTQRSSETVPEWAPEGNKALGAEMFALNAKVFEENLVVHIQNTRSSLQSDLNRRLRLKYKSFKDGCDSIFSLDQLEEQRRIFREEVYPAMRAVDRLLDEIHQANHDAILATAQNVENVEKTTREVKQWMMLGLALALVLASFACYKLARSILGPIQSLTSATQELGRGNLDQVVPVTSKDELGDLADAFNKMAAQLRLYRQSTSDKIVRLHRTMDATLASFPDPIFVLNREGDIELMNLAASELARALGLKDGLPEPVQETAREALAEGRSFLPHSFKEVVSFRLDGQEKFFLPRVLAMRNEEEALIGVAVVLYDVTRFRLLDDAKTNLVSTVSHEIRTPLTSVRMVLHLLLEKTVGALTPRQTDLITAARDDAERLLRIINDLLDLTRLEEGNTDLNKEKTTPSELVTNVADAMREVVTNKNLKLTCRTEPDLPPVMVDRQRINHVFNNLINNAIKYSPPGGEIVLEAARSNDREVQFTVTDHGPGVPEDHQDRIFDRFYRVPGQTKTGAGLGLSIAREIVVAHGGRIGVRHGMDGGSEFYFVLGEADGEASP